MAQTGQRWRNCSDPGYFPAYLRWPIPHLAAREGKRASYAKGVALSWSALAKLSDIAVNAPASVICEHLKRHADADADARLTHQKRGCQQNILRSKMSLTFLKGLLLCQLEKIRKMSED
jgi:hypothetical protein